MAIIIGLDLGQTTDPTALAVLEVTQRPHRKVPDRKENLYYCSYLNRFTLGTPYTQIVDDVTKMMRKPPLTGATLAIDQTGVGRAVYDMFARARIMGWLRPITITAGNKVTKIPEESGFHVPKKELVSTMQVLLQFQRIRIAGKLKDAKVLIRELQNFKVKITAAANETFGAWREGAHDDLVFAVALAAWIGENSALHWDGSLGGTGEYKAADIEEAPRGVFLDHHCPSPWS